MEASNKHNNKKFLKEEFTKDVGKHHKEYLGTTVPENYFATSKMAILDKIKQENNIAENPKKQLVFYMRPQFKYIAAASLVFIISLTLWLQKQTNEDDVNIPNIETLALTDDVLVESLLIDDTNIDEFTATTLFEEVMVKAEIKEQEMDNLIINSLIVEDSLLDDYLKKELVETIIL